MPQQSPSADLSKIKRLRILTPAEREDLYARPELTEYAHDSGWYPFLGNLSY